MIAASEQLIEAPGLILGAALFAQQLLGAVLHLAQHSHVLLVEVGQFALVLLERLGQGLQCAIEARLAFAHQVLLGLIEALDRLLEYSIRQALKDDAEVLHLNLMLLSESLQILTRTHEFGVAHRQLRAHCAIGLTRRVRAALSDHPRHRRSHHEADHRTQNCDHVAPLRFSLFTLESRCDLGVTFERESSLSLVSR